jgi:hypothetical protein
MASRPIGVQRDRQPVGREDVAHGAHDEAAVACLMIVTVALLGEPTV